MSDRKHAHDCEQIERQLSACERDLRECVELLREMEPHIDSLICYGSTCLEYKPNDFVRRYHALLARLKERGV